MSDARDEKGREPDRWIVSWKLAYDDEPWGAQHEAGIYSDQQSAEDAAGEYRDLHGRQSTVRPVWFATPPATEAARGPAETKVGTLEVHSRGVTIKHWAGRSGGVVIDDWACPLEKGTYTIHGPHTE